MTDGQQPAQPAKFCATCAHVYRRGSEPASMWRCTAPQGQRVSQVSGAVEMAMGGDCALLRATSMHCGFDGQWWQAQEEK